MNELKQFAKLLADESGKIIKSYFRSDMKIESKADDTPVTIADRSAEEIMRNLIMKYYPEHGIIGEEFGTTNENAEYKWVLDPIDGTKSFVCGAYSFGTLIALLKNDMPMIGVINQPVLNEFMIGDNEETLLNGNPVKVRKCDDLSKAVLLTTDHLLIEQYRDIKKFEQLIRDVKLYRQWGDCYGYALLSAGYADIMIDPILEIWDSMALIPVVRGAGGIVTSYDGGDPLPGKSMIAASPAIHSQVVQILN